MQNSKLNMHFVTGDPNALGDQLGNRRFWPIPATEQQATAGMNRAERRALARGKHQQPERIVPLPKILDEFTVFDMAQTIIDKISHGEIEAYQGRPVFRDNTGALCEVCPALAGWIETWHSINDRLGTNINLTPLEKLLKRLHNSVPITEAEIHAAADTLHSMRLVFRASDRKVISSIAKTAQIKILLESKP
jgi:hypothetical protein